ncbi:MAG TPA: hypothetical protein VN203_10495, partial [Candidatus Acidoferrum sp.]|nr:hypothetical protein [Candidatus Acidoferrum sp.]
FRLCASLILPFDYLAVVEELKSGVNDLRAKAGDTFDLSPLTEKLTALGSVVEKLRRRTVRLKQGGKDTMSAWVINRCLMEVGRALIPVNYTRTGQFDQDLAIPTHPLPGLQAVVKLMSMDKASDARQFLLIRLVRERNRVVHGILSASRAVEEALNALGEGS